MAEQQAQQGGEAVSGWPRGGKFFEVADFKGLNTQSPRQSIDDQEQSYIENLFPVGAGNLRAMYDIGTSIYTASGQTIIEIFAYNIGAVPYMAVFFSNGEAIQVNINTSAATTISSTANTFYTSGGNLPQCVQWGNNGILIVGTVTTSGYWAWDGTTLWPPGNATSPTWLNGGTATAMPTGVSGTAIEIFQNRVWIANSNTVTFSGPGNGANFSGTVGGGSFTSSDGFLRQQYIGLKQSNGYLYLFGDSSINYIGNVQTTTVNSTVVTTFNNLNTDPQVGTPWNFSVTPFGRALMLSNTSGVYAMFGGSAEKVSTKLDGLFAGATLPLTGLTNMPCGAVATVFGIRVFFLLIKAVDTFTNQPKPMMVAWDGNKWFIVTQSFTPTFITTQEINSQLTAWGTDGTNIYPMFQTPSSITKKMQCKQWNGSSWIVDKQELRCYLQTFNFSGQTYSISYQVDTETQVATPTVINAAGGQIQFVNNSGGNIQFTGLGSAPIYFYSTSGSFIIGFDPNGIYGKLMGIAISSTSQNFTIVSLGVLYKNYRAYT